MIDMPSAPSAKLTPRQAKAIESLLTGASQDSAAAAAGVTRRTITRWLQTPSFCDILRQAESERLAAVTRQLLTLASQAVDTLAAGMAGNALPTQIRAADLTLTHLTRTSELQALTNRLAEVTNPTAAGSAREFLANQLARLAEQKPDTAK